MADVGASLKSTGVLIPVTSDPDLTVVTVLQFTQALYDSGGFFSVGSPTRLTFPEDGKYIVGFSCVFQYNINGQRAAYVRKNGLAPILKEIYFASQNGATDAQTLRGQRVKQFTAGDYVDLAVAQDSSSTLQILNTQTFEGVPNFYQEFSPILWAQRVG